MTAVCDLRPDRLAEMAKTYQCGNTYKDFRTMLREADMDAVAVFTPAPLHVWMATEAMKAGKHVISAVPAGMSLEELAQLIECKEKTGMTYMMAETSFSAPRSSPVACGPARDASAPSSTPKPSTTTKG